MPRTPSSSLFALLGRGSVARPGTSVRFGNRFAHHSQRFVAPLERLVDSLLPVVRALEVSDRLLAIDQVEISHRLGVLGANRDRFFQILNRAVRKRDPLFTNDVAWGKFGRKLAIFLTRVRIDTRIELGLVVSAAFQLKQLPDEDRRGIL